VSKQVAAKTPLEILVESPQEINPALVMAWRLKEREREGLLGIDVLLELGSEIDAAIEEGARQERESVQMLNRLAVAPGQPSKQVPDGF
jgi:hypothetical protein